MDGCFVIYYEYHTDIIFQAWFF